MYNLQVFQMIQIRIEKMYQNKLLWEHGVELKTIVFESSGLTIRPLKLVFFFSRQQVANKQGIYIDSSSRLLASNTKTLQLVATLGWLHDVISNKLYSTSSAAVAQWQMRRRRAVVDQLLNDRYVYDTIMSALSHHCILILNCFTFLLFGNNATNRR